MSSEGPSEVLVLVAGYPPAFLGGGPIRTLEAMVENRTSNTPVSVLTSAHDHGLNEALDVRQGEWTRRGRAEVFYANLRTWRGRRRMAAEVRRSPADILYLNSLFSFWFTICPLLMLRLRCARFSLVVLAPRGELHPGALQLKRSKKRLFLGIAHVIGLYRAVCFHASTDAEAEQIREAFPHAEILVKENETLVKARPAPDAAVREPPLRLACVGRVSPKKRVHVLIEALAAVGEKTDLELVVHGGGDADYLAECASLAQRTGARVTFAGPLEHERVAGAFDSADYACFATAGENFGHVIAEALARGCPVLVGDVTPWTPVIAAGGGQVLDDASSAQAWAECFRSLAQRSPREHRETRRSAWEAFRRWDETREAETFLDRLTDHAGAAR